MTTLTFNLTELKRISAIPNTVDFDAADLSQSWLIVDNAADNRSERVSLATLESRYQVAGDYLVDADIGVTVQAYNARLTDIAGLTPSDGAIIIGDGANFVTESGATARTSLGLGSAAIADATDFATAAQGTLADSAVQPGDLAAVAYSGDYDDLIGSPTLGTLAAENWPTSDGQEYVAKNGAWAVATGGGGSSLPVVDETAIVYKTGQPTYTVTLDADALTAARTKTLQNTSATLAELETAQTFTAAQVIQVATASNIPLTLKTTDDDSTNLISRIRSSSDTLLSGFDINGTLKRYTIDTPLIQYNNGTSANNNPRITPTTPIGSGVDLTISGMNRLILNPGFAVRFAGSTVEFAAGINWSMSNNTFQVYQAANVIFQTHAANVQTIRAGSNQDGILRPYSDSYCWTINRDNTAITSSVINGLLIQAAQSSGGASAGFGTALGFQIKSSTSAKQDAARLIAKWTTATHATRQAQSDWTAYDYSAERTVISIGANGSAGLLSFFGGTPVARPSTYTLAATATRTMPTPESAFTGIDNAQVGSVYAQVADLQTLQTRLNSVEGVLRQLITDLASTSGYGLLVAS